MQARNRSINWFIFHVDENLIDLIEGQITFTSKDKRNIMKKKRNENASFNWTRDDPAYAMEVQTR